MKKEKFYTIHMGANGNTYLELHEGYRYNIGTVSFFIHNIEEYKTASGMFVLHQRPSWSITEASTGMGICYENFATLRDAKKKCESLFYKVENALRATEDAKSRFENLVKNTENGGNIN